jgi:transcriptional regulator with XRE-family HTH domain
VKSGARLRLARQARGLSQQQLAGMAAVTRQAVSAVESGQSDPSLRVALALAVALGMTVEELFGSQAAGPTVTARLVAGASTPDLLGASGRRVTLAPIGESLVALPLSGPTVSRAGFVAAGGLIAGQGGARPGLATGGEVEVGPIGPPRPTLVVAGCDPALPLLEQPLSLLDPPIAFGWWPCSTQEALRLAAAGLVHAAGVHGPAGDGGDALGGGEVIGFSAWREGLVLRPDAASQSVADVVRQGLRLVNREPGAEARRVLDQELASAGIDPSSVPGYHTRAAGHLQVADAIAAGLADAGVASEPAALAHGLGFVPLAAERFDLVIPAAAAATREAQALVKVLSSRWLLDQLASLPGYDPTPCGVRMAA